MQFVSVLLLKIKTVILSNDSKTKIPKILTGIYQEQRWQCPKWPVTCWCWSPLSACPCSSGGLLSHCPKQRQTCHEAQVIWKDLGEGVKKMWEGEKISGHWQSSTRGQFCHDMMLITKNNKLQNNRRKTTVSPPSQVHQVNLADNLWRKVIF